MDAADAAPGLLPGPAADGYTQPESGVLYEGCHSWEIYYSLNLPGAADWSLDLDVVGPDGVSVGGDYEYGDGSSASGTADHQVCSFEDAGRYTVEASGDWCDADYDCYPFTLPTSSFQIRPAKTRTTLSVRPKNPSYNQNVTFTVRVKDERPNGFFPSDGVDVVLQTRRNGKWVKARAGELWVYDGKDTQTYNWNIRGLVEVRAITKRQENLDSSQSKVLKVR